MKSKFSKAFDALGSDERTRRERTERILAEYEDDAASQELPKSKYIAKRRGVSGRRATAIVTACVVLLAALASLLIVLTNSGGLLNALSLLKGTYVDMDGIAAFGVWSAPDSSSDEAYISDVAYINSSVAYAADEELPADSPEDGDGILSGEWSDEERYDWESDYDWDPSKANVLISINEDGSVSEVVYERTNGRGRVRQDSLGNAVKVYVSKNFTYVMYVSDDDWGFWRDINFAQETVSPQSFTCHHEMQQTIVIHNATGKVFALNDIVSQVNEYSGAVNHTLAAYPYKNDVLCVSPMYGNYIDQWYNVYPDSLPTYDFAGIPATYAEQKDPVYLLYGGLADCLSDAEVENLLRSRVLTDGEAIQILCARGYGDALGAKAEPYFEGTYLRTVFTDHAVNKGLQVGFFEPPFVKEAYKLSGNLEPISVYKSASVLGNEQNDCGTQVADGILRPSAGGSWVVLGSSAWSDKMNFSRRMQIVRAVEYIGGKLDAIVLTPSRLMLYPRTDKNGKVTAVTVLNASIETQEPVALFVRSARSNDAIFLNEEGQSKPETSQTDGGMRVKLPRLAPWSAGTVLFSEELDR